MLPPEAFLAFFSFRFSFSDFCAVFLPSFFGFSCPFMGPAYATSPTANKRAARRPPCKLRFPSVSAAQAAGQAQSHIGWSLEPRPPHEGGYLRTTRSEAAARPRFQFPP